MLYSLHELAYHSATPFRFGAHMARQFWSSPFNPASQTAVGRTALASAGLFESVTRRYGKPAWGLETIDIGGKPVRTTEQVIWSSPWCRLVRFARNIGDLKRAKKPTAAPAVLIVAPLTGHYATLLRGTVARMVENAEVYVTDWADAKMVPVEVGTFDLDDYIDYLIEFLEHIGPQANGQGAHMMAVCQPSVPAFATTAIMNSTGHPCRPASLTMMGGPIDTRESPTEVNDHATNKPHVWFRHNSIATVPSIYPGEGRRVYPGFVQLASFMSMNLQSHMMSHWGLFRHLMEGADVSADATKAFYDEYRSVCDMTAEFYLQTVDVVFQRHALPRGEFAHRGKRVDLGDIRDTALLCIEGERDDISGIGQTRAALKLTPNLPESMKHYFLAPEAGHYGIFNGSKWRETIAPVVEDWIARFERPKAKLKAVS